MIFQEFFFDYTIEELLRPDGLVREFYYLERKIHVVVSRRLLIQRIYFINFVQSGIIWLLIPGGGYSAYRVKRECERKYYYSGGVFGTRINVYLPREDFNKEICEIEPDILNSKILECMHNDKVFMNEGPLLLAFLKYYINARPIYSLDNVIVNTVERPEHEKRRLKDYFDL